MNETVGRRRRAARDVDLTDTVVFDGALGVVHHVDGLGSAGRHDEPDRGGSAGQMRRMWRHGQLLPSESWMLLGN